MMQKTISFLFLTALSACLFGQTNYEKFKKLYKDKDTLKIKSLISEWEKTNPNDPELYTSAFNFYYSTSEEEILALSKEPHGNQTFQLADSTGNVTGYFSTNLGYNSEKLEKAFSYIDKGIELFPNRLDMRFGKCYVLLQIRDYEIFTNEIMNTIEYSDKIKNNWIWSENKKLDDAEDFMLGIIQTYLKQLYDTEDDNLLSNMIRIGDKALNYYPENIELLSTTAVVNILTGDYDKALNYLKQAEAINSKDFIVLNNIAQAYKLKGDNQAAIKYYLLTEKYGDDQAKKHAREEMEKLKK